MAEEKWKPFHQHAKVQDASGRWRYPEDLANERRRRHEAGYRGRLRAPKDTVEFFYWHERFG